ncbi:MAG: LPXTG cell wall anchor domain-containing protein, partial [Solobacterium sp.]|nr:LPXTG cell wall anchor domain-containing protein [Solobacterium sp.]
LFGNGYWTLHATVTEMVPYETIVKVDESLKTGEVEEDVAGVLGDKTGKYDIMYSPYEDLPGDTYKQYTSDVIYADLLANVDTNPAVSDMFSKPWGDVTVTSFTSSPATNRVLRVGIDYTHFVTEDGTSVIAADGTPVAKKYGLQPQETFAGYEYVTTRTEANGDRVHVYKKASATPVAPSPATPTTPAAPAASTPEAPATPKTGDTNLFAAFAMLVSGMIASAAAFITKKKNA